MRAEVRIRFGTGGLSFGQMDQSRRGVYFSFFLLRRRGSSDDGGDSASRSTIHPPTAASGHQRRRYVQCTLRARFRLAKFWVRQKRGRAMPPCHAYRITQGLISKPFDIGNSTPGIIIRRILRENPGRKPNC